MDEQDRDRRYTWRAFRRQCRNAFRRFQRGAAKHVTVDLALDEPFKRTGSSLARGTED